MDEHTSFIKLHIHVHVIHFCIKKYFITSLLLIIVTQLGIRIVVRLSIVVRTKILFYTATNVGGMSTV